MRIAVITAFSERAVPLVKQCIVSCYQCMRQAKDIEFCFYVYECNWVGEDKRFYQKPITTRTDEEQPTVEFPIQPFSRPIDLAPELDIDVPIVQLPASHLTSPHTFLPDMLVYQDFADHYLDDFDYTLFCHDDIIFNDQIDLFSEMLNYLNSSSALILAEPHLECYDYISVRFYPHFVFVGTKTFRDLNLSWVNDLCVIDTDTYKVRPVYNDGGAALFASYYHKRNASLVCSMRRLPTIWFRHLRLAGLCVGVEAALIYGADAKQKDTLFKEAERYVDSKLYGGL
jgi:hypothetical protein